MITGEARQRVAGWFAGRLPAEWQTAPADITVDREEITVRLTIPDVGLDADATDVDPGRGSGRPPRLPRGDPGPRMEIAREAEHRYDAKVSWGVSVGEGDDRHSELWTHVAAPGDDPAAPAAAAGARHPRRRRGRAVALGRAGLVRAAGRPARGGLARRAARGDESVSDVRARARLPDTPASSGPQAAGRADSLATLAALARSIAFGMATWPAALSPEDELVATGDGDDRAVGVDAVDLDLGLPTTMSTCVLAWLSPESIRSSVDSSSPPVNDDGKPIPQAMWEPTFSS